MVLVIIVLDGMLQAPSEQQEMDSLEEYARQLVESSEVMVNGIRYHGAYESEEVTTMPQGFELVGITELLYLAA